MKSFNYITINSNSSLICCKICPAYPAGNPFKSQSIFATNGRFHPLETFIAIALKRLIEFQIKV